MQVIIERSEIQGKIIPPSSKSYTHRSLVCASLAKGKSKIISPLISDDTKATMDVLRKIGIEIDKKRDSLIVDGGCLSVPREDLFCEESGTTLRLMTAVCSLIKGKCRLTGHSSLLRRPVKPLVDALKRLGVDCFCNGEFPPVVVNDNLVGGKTILPGNISSQFVSALLLISPLTPKETKISLSTELESKPYVLMTIDTQKKFGIEIETDKNLLEFSASRQEYKPTDFAIEKDWSVASFLLAAGALSGKTNITKINHNSLQADREIIKILEMMGADVVIKPDSISIAKSELNPINFDVSNCPDLFPVLCVLCSVAEGNSKITGIRRLRMKESDRVSEMENGLKRMGVKVKVLENSMEITGSEVKGTAIDSKDHRIAMAFGTFGLAANGKTVIKNAECVSKSFPDFWNYLNKLNANVQLR